jgi:hypothetical protein
MTTQTETRASYLFHFVHKTSNECTVETDTHTLDAEERLWSFDLKESTHVGHSSPDPKIYAAHASNSPLLREWEIDWTLSRWVI